MSLRATTTALFLAFLLSPLAAHAKDLRNRFGLGYNAQLGGLPAISLKYTLPAKDKAINLAVEGLGGATLPSDGSQEIMAGLRVLYGVVAEDQMNLYVGLGGLYVHSDAAAFAGVRAQPVLGAEFFLYGLDNLGFSLEVGVNLDVDLVAGGVGASTAASSMGGLGLHYYF